MANKYICPYCYQENKMSEVDFRCTNKQCGEEKDELLTQYRGGSQNIITQRAFRAPKSFLGKMPTYAECTQCKVTTGIRLCPKCHNPLPQAIDESNDMIISVIGARDSGKSNYVGVLVHELEKRVFNRFDFSFGMIRESQEEYKKRFGKYLFPNEYDSTAKDDRQAHTVPRTEAHVKGTNIIKSLPIVCELAKRDGKIKRYSLSFLDSAGEDFEDPIAMATVMPYVANSKGIIFLLDPLQILAVRNQIRPDIVEKSGSVNAKEVISYENIVQNVATLIRTNKKMKSSEPINIPVVITFSKFDILKDIVDASSRLWKDSPHVDLGAFDDGDLKQVNDEMMGLLQYWGESNFIKSVREEFSNVRYLPCSAFGSCPDASRNVAPPKSLRIEDGILWILKELKKIPVKK